jgi:enediyne biosynthesis protein E4
VLREAVPRRWLALAIAAIGVIAIEQMSSMQARQGASSTPVHLPTFRDVASSRGLDFVHVNGASDDKFFPEIMGSGGLFLDFDNDGWLDVFLVDGGSFADPTMARRAHHRLYRNRGNGSFADVTSASGIRQGAYGMGACAGDADNDGLIDLYVTTVGPNQFFRNAGGGRFTEVLKAAGAAGDSWSTSCAFVDIDRDGYLDIFVSGYVDAPPEKNPFCGVAGPPPIRDYCHPLIYPALTSTLYRNTGSGAFEDISVSSGIARHRGNGLGVAVSDVDEDGWPDVFVANDSMPNFLFHNERNRTFTETAGLAGVAVSSDGKAKAGMGTAFGDFSGTGRFGLIVTNHETEMHSLFLSLGGGLFSDVTIKRGVGPATRPYVGFGVAFVDYDNDMRPDVAIANGHVMANAAQLRAGAKYGQRNLLLRNTGDRFVDMRNAAGSGFASEMVSRGLVAGDIDNDGDVDLLITNNGGAANLLLNEGGAGNAIVVRAVGDKSPSTLRASNRSAIGTRLTMSVGQQRQLREVQSGSSYLGQNDLRAHFGLGRAARAERLEITWPSGATEVVENLAANHVFTVHEGKGIVGRVPFAR